MADMDILIGKTLSECEDVKSNPTKSLVMVGVNLCLICLILHNVCRNRDHQDQTDHHRRRGHDGHHGPQAGQAQCGARRRESGQDY